MGHSSFDTETQPTEGKTEMTTSYLLTHVICHTRTLLSAAPSIGLVRNEHRFSHLALGSAWSKYS